MHHILAVKIVDGLQDLSNSLGCVLFRESSLLADSIEQLTASCELSKNIVFVLRQESS